MDEWMNTLLNACFWWLLSNGAAKMVISVPLSLPPIA